MADWKKAASLAAIVAAFACLVVPSSAFAVDSTVLCSENAEICPAGKQLAVGATFEGKTVAALLGSSLGNLFCSSTFKGRTTGPNKTETNAPVNAEITTMTWTECELGLGGPKCTVNAVNLAYAATFQTEGVKGNGSFTITDPVGVGVTTVCGTLMNCTYTTASAKTAYTGGVTGTANWRFEAVPLTGAGTKCGTKPFLSGTWSLVSPAEMWVEM